MRHAFRSLYYSSRTLVTHTHQGFILLLQGLIWIIAHLWSYGLDFSAWLLHHLVAPFLCFACIYAGIILTFPLPTALWYSLAQPTLNYLNAPPLSAFPLADMLDSASMTRALLTALPLAVAVFRRHFTEWYTSQAPLGARVLYACYAGVVWPKAWWYSNGLLSRLRQHSTRSHNNDP